MPGLASSVVFGGGGKMLPSRPKYDPTTQTVSGRAQPNASVTIRIDNAPVGTAIADGQGVWQLVLGKGATAGQTIVASADVVSDGLTLPIPPVTAARTLGVRAGTVSNIASKETWLGAPIDHVVLFAEQNNAANSWADNLAFTQNQVSVFGGSGRDLRWAVPICTGQSGEGIDATIAGTHDAAIEAIARVIHEAGLPGRRRFVRLGWEPNFLTAYPWGSQIVTPAQYRAGFQKVASIFRSVSRLFVIQFVVASRKDSGVNFEPMYPGDDWVDTIGVDAYCLSQDKGTDNVPTNDEGHADFMFTAPFGINRIRDFAAARGKPFSVDEWGVNYDNPFYVRRMAAFVRANDVTHHAYWDQNNGIFTCQLSQDQHPLAASEFVTQFGPFNILTQGLAAAPNGALSGAVLATKALSRIEVSSGDAGVSGSSVTAAAQASGTRRVTVRGTDERGLTAERSIFLTWQLGSVWTPEARFGSRLIDARRVEDLSRVLRHLGAVKSIASRTGADRPATAPDVASRPTLTKRNGYQIAMLDGGDALVQTQMANVPQAQAAITRAVMAYTDPAAPNFTYLLADSDAAGASRAIGVNAGNLRVGASGGFAGDPIIGADRSIVVSFASGATPRGRGTVDGAAEKTTTLPIAATTYTKRVYGASGAASNGIASQYRGGIYEDFDVSGVLTAAEEAEVHGYFAWAYGRESSLPTAHPYRSNPPMGF